MRAVDGSRRQRNVQIWPPSRRKKNSVNRTRKNPAATSPIVAAVLSAPEVSAPWLSVIAFCNRSMPSLSCVWVRCSGPRASQFCTSSMPSATCVTRVSSCAMKVWTISPRPPKTTIRPVTSTRAADSDRFMPRLRRAAATGWNRAASSSATATGITTTRSSADDPQHQVPRRHEQDEPPRPRAGRANAARQAVIDRRRLLHQHDRRAGVAQLGCGPERRRRPPPPGRREAVPRLLPEGPAPGSGRTPVRTSIGAPVVVATHQVAPFVVHAGPPSGAVIRSFWWARPATAGRDDSGSHDGRGPWKSETELVVDRDGLTFPASSWSNPEPATDRWRWVRASESST